jgi:DNA-binding XRE family transcriptional regulator
VKPENRVKERRVAQLLTQRELANLAGMKRLAVLRIENRQVYPSLLSKQQLAYALRTTIDDLFPREAASR